MRPVGVTKKGKKGQKLSCVKLAICPDHPRRDRPLKFCMRGRVREVVIYFKLRENRLRGLGAVGGRKLPSPIDEAHGLYVQLVLLYKPWCWKSHTRTVVRECFKGDEASQWKRPKFDPSPHPNPLTDLHKNWHAWLRPGRHPACKIL